MKQDFDVVQLGPQAQIPAEGDYRQVPTFEGGIDLRQSQENTPVGSSPDMDDMEVDLDGRLCVMPGVRLAETLAHAPSQVILHPGYYFSSSLVFLAPPYIGIKSNSVTSWYNVGLPVGTYGYTDFAGVLLLSAGVVGTYYREPDKQTVQLIPGAPAALGLTTFANRVVLGATIVSGNFDLMGIGWSDATADYKGWDPAQGQGSETMIGSMKRADRFMGFAPLGFTQLGIINRRSLWIANKTGDEFEPMDIVAKLEDTGATHAATVLPTEYGGVFLSDDGVRVFDGNQAPVISEPINKQLLPIYENLNYSASVDPQRKRYYLHSPTNTWIFDIKKKIWFRKPSVYLASVWFPDQGLNAPTWGGASGTWGSQTLAWWQLQPQESGGSMYYVRGTQLGEQDASLSTELGVAMTPRWYDKRDVGENQDYLYTSQNIYLTYESTASATVQFWLPDDSGDYALVTTEVLPSTAGKTGRFVSKFVWTGRGLGLGIVVVGGQPRLRKASIRYQQTSVL